MLIYISSRQFWFILSFVYLYITKISKKKKKQKSLRINDTELVTPVFIDESQIPLLMTKN